MRRAKKYKNVRRRYEGTAARAAHKKPDICLKACEKDFVTLGTVFEYLVCYNYSFVYVSRG